VSRAESYTTIRNSRQAILHPAEWMPSCLRNRASMHSVTDATLNALASGRSIIGLCNRNMARMRLSGLSIAPYLKEP